jgi:nitrate reductase gamma subunit
MTDIQLLTWARGTGMQIAASIFVLGIVVRLLEIFLLGRKRDLAEARGGQFGPGLRTVFTRSVPKVGTTKGTAFTYVAGYIFHIGFLLTLFFFTPHILFFKGLTGWSWPALPVSLIDVCAVISIAALVALLIHRFVDPVRRHLSGLGDYVSWVVTTLPLVTGYMALNRIGGEYNDLLVVHLLSVELLLVVLPFTKLIHAITFVFSRWYNGAFAGRRGVRA